MNQSTKRMYSQSKKSSKMSRQIKIKTIDEYMKIPYRMKIAEDAAEGSYVASYPALKGCITCGSTIEAALKDSYDIPARIFFGEIP